MKTETRVMDVTTTLQGEKIAMKLNEDSLAHLMGTFIDLYSDPEMAVIREYSTNAYDAHIEAGVTQPIEITLPTALSPFLRIRDYGYGLDVEDIRDIYSQYGASTKRESNDVVGMLGLGCKSALTYTDQFTLTGIKDGVCTQVSISRDEDGSGSMTIVDQYETDEPSGVEVIIPTKTRNNFADKAAEFFRFWKSGTVLVGGEEPKQVSGFWLVDDILLTPEITESVIVMGNVPYPIPNQPYLYGRWPYVAFVKIGDVNFTPAREALQMTKKTVAAIHTVEERIKTERDSAVEDYIASASSHAEALSRAIDTEKLGYKGTPIYQGEEIPTSITAAGTRFVVADAIKRWRRRGWDASRVISASIWPKTIWLTGYELDKLSPHKRKKLDQWAAEKNLSGHTHYVLLNEVPIKDWVDPSTIYDWTEVEAQKVKIERNNKTGLNRVSGSYEVSLDGVHKYDVLATDIDTSKPLFFIPKAYGFYGNAKKLIEKTYPHYTVALLGRNRINKFKRDFPMATNVNDHLKELAENFMNSLSSTNQMMIHINESGEATKLSKFDPKLINDPEFSTIVRLSKKIDQKLLDDYYLYKGWAINNYSVKSIMDKYILLTHVGRYDTMSKTTMDHFYTYFNAAFAASQEA